MFLWWNTKQRTLWFIGLCIVLGIPLTSYIHVSSQMKRLPRVLNTVRRRSPPPPPTSTTTNITSRFFLEDNEINETCRIEHACNSWFEKTFEENLKIVANYSVAKQSEYPPLGNPKITLTSFPVIVTAASSGFFDLSQGLLESIYEKILPKYADVKVLYYDMGIKTSDVRRLRKFCKICIIRKFDFRKYPSHVAHMKSYAWKPLIVKEALRDYSWVWWMDSSARITSGDLDRALEYSRKHSIWYYPYVPSLSMAKYTDKRMIEFLGEDVCKFRYFGEIEAGFVLYHFDDVTKTVVDVWNACALDSRCISPPGAQLSCNNLETTDGQCHRFDQSALSIILRRLFHGCNVNPQVSKPSGIHVIRRKEKVSLISTFFSFLKNRDTNCLKKLLFPLL